MAAERANFWSFLVTQPQPRCPKFDLCLHGLYGKSSYFLPTSSCFCPLSTKKQKKKRKTRLYITFRTLTANGKMNIHFYLTHVNYCVRVHRQCLEDLMIVVQDFYCFLYLYTLRKTKRHISSSEAREMFIRGP